MTAREQLLDALALVEALRNSAAKSPPTIVMDAWVRALERRDEACKRWLEEDANGPRS